MANESLNTLATYMNNLNRTYDNTATPGTDDTLADIADYSGCGASFPSSTYNNGGRDIGLASNFDPWASANSNWEGKRVMRNIGTDGQDAYCNQFVAVLSADFVVQALADDVKVYVNDVLQLTLTSAGDSSSVGASAGDKIGITRPATITSGTAYDRGVAYLGWSGFVFAHRRDRNSGATLTIVALEADTDYEVRYTTTDGAQTTTTGLATGNIASAYGTATATMSSTRNHIIYANKPVACYVRLAAGSGVNDTLPLYPLDQDPKFGAFTTGGHIFAINNASHNRGAVNVVQQVLNRSSDGTSTTERNTNGNYRTFYIDITPGETSAGFFAGPVQKLQTGNNQLIGAEQQGDGDGSEMTPFVSSKAMGKCSATGVGTTDYVCCIAESALTVERRSSNGVLISSQTMAGSATYNVYFTTFSGPINEGDIFTSTGNFIMYSDGNNSIDDEQVFYMGEDEFPINNVQSEIAPDYGNSTDACNNGPTDPKVPVYFVNSFTAGEAAYADANLTQELSDVYPSGTWYWTNTGGRGVSFTYVAWNSSGTGGIQNITTC
jgi:hypothetical protein